MTEPIAEMKRWYETSARPFLLEHEPAKADELDADIERVLAIDRRAEEDLAICFLRASGVGKSTLIMSESRAPSNRNAWATSSESAHCRIIIHRLPRFFLSRTSRAVSGSSSPRSATKASSSDRALRLGIVRKRAIVEVPPYQHATVPVAVHRIESAPLDAATPDWMIADQDQRPDGLR
jgi:hypothetical protein